MGPWPSLQRFAVLLLRCASRLVAIVLPQRLDLPLLSAIRITLGKSPSEPSSLLLQCKSLSLELRKSQHVGLHANGVSLSVLDVNGKESVGSVSLGMLVSLALSSQQRSALSARLLVSDPIDLSLKPEALVRAAELQEHLHSFASVTYTIPPAPASPAPPHSAAKAKHCERNRLRNAHSGFSSAQKSKKLVYASSMPFIDMAVEFAGLSLQLPCDSQLHASGISFGVCLSHSLQPADVFVALKHCSIRACNAHAALSYAASVRAPPAAQRAKLEAAGSFNVNIRDMTPPSSADIANLERALQYLGTSSAEGNHANESVNQHLGDQGEIRNLSACLPGRVPNFEMRAIRLDGTLQLPGQSEIEISTSSASKYPCSVDLSVRFKKLDEDFMPHSHSLLDARLEYLLPAKKVHSEGNASLFTAVNADAPARMAFTAQQSTHLDVPTVQAAITHTNESFRSIRASILTSVASSSSSISPPSSSSSRAERNHEALIWLPYQLKMSVSLSYLTVVLDRARQLEIAHTNVYMEAKSASANIEDVYLKCYGSIAAKWRSVCACTQNPLSMRTLAVSATSPVVDSALATRCNGPSNISTLNQCTACVDQVPKLNPGQVSIAGLVVGADAQAQVIAELFFVTGTLFKASAVSVQRATLSLRTWLLLYLPNGLSGTVSFGSELTCVTARMPRIEFAAPIDLLDILKTLDDIDAADEATSTAAAESHCLFRGACACVSDMSLSVTHEQASAWNKSRLDKLPPLCASFLEASCTLCAPGPAMTANLHRTSFSSEPGKASIQIEGVGAHILDCRRLRWTPLLENCSANATVADDSSGALLCCVDGTSAIEAVLTPSSVATLQSATSALSSWTAQPVASWTIRNECGSESINVFAQRANNHQQITLRNSEQIVLWPSGLSTSQAMLRYGSGAIAVINANFVSLSCEGSNAERVDLNPFGIWESGLVCLIDGRAVVERQDAVGSDFLVCSQVRLRNTTESALNVQMADGPRTCNYLLQDRGTHRLSLGANGQPFRAACKPIPLHFADRDFSIQIGTEDKNRTEISRNDVAEGCRQEIGNGMSVWRTAAGTSCEELIFFHALSVRCALPFHVSISLIESVSSGKEDLKENCLQEMRMPPNNSKPVPVCVESKGSIVLEIREKLQGLHERLKVTQNQRGRDKYPASSREPGFTVHGGSMIRAQMQMKDSISGATELVLSPASAIRNQLDVPLQLQLVFDHQGSWSDLPVYTLSADHVMLVRPSDMLAQDSMLRVRTASADSEPICWSAAAEMSMIRASKCTSLLVPGVSPLSVTYAEGSATISLFPLGRVVNNCSNAIEVLHEPRTNSVEPLQSDSLSSYASARRLILKPEEEGYLPIAQHTAPSRRKWRVAYASGLATSPLDLLPASRSLSYGTAMDDVVEANRGMQLLRVCIATNCTSISDFVNDGGWAPTRLLNATREMLAIKQVGSTGPSYHCAPGASVAVVWNAPHTLKRCLAVTSDREETSLGELMADRVFVHGFCEQVGSLCVYSEAEPSPSAGGPCLWTSVAHTFADAKRGLLQKRSVSLVECKPLRMECRIPWIGCSIRTDAEEVLHARVAGITATVKQPHYLWTWALAQMGIEQVRVECCATDSEYSVFLDAPSATEKQQLSALQLTWAVAAGSSLPREYAASFGYLTCSMAALAVKLDGKVIRRLFRAFEDLTASPSDMRVDLPPATDRPAKGSASLQKLFLVSGISLTPPPQVSLALTSVMPEKSALRSVTCIDHAIMKFPELRASGPLRGPQALRLLTSELVRQLNWSSSIPRGVLSIMSLTMSSRVLSVPRALAYSLLTGDTVSLRKSLIANFALSASAAEDAVHALNVLAGGLELQPPPEDARAGYALATSLNQAVYALAAAPVHASRHYGVLVGVPLGTVSSALGLVLRPGVSMWCIISRGCIRMLTRDKSTEGERKQEHAPVAAVDELNTQQSSRLLFAASMFAKAGSTLATGNCLFQAQHGRGSLTGLDVSTESVC